MSYMKMSKYEELLTIAVNKENGDIVYSLKKKDLNIMEAVGLVEIIKLKLLKKYHNWDKDTEPIATTEQPKKRLFRKKDKTPKTIPRRLDIERG